MKISDSGRQWYEVEYEKVSKYLMLAYSLGFTTSVVPCLGTTRAHRLTCSQLLTPLPLSLPPTLLFTSISLKSFMCNSAKPAVDNRAKDFVIGEYLDRVIQYGYLTLFAAAFPLAPLAVLLTFKLDMIFDVRRYLWGTRRPIATR